MSDVALRILTPDDAAAYRALRLAGLQESPEAFSSAFEDERDFPAETWIDRVTPKHDPPDAFALGAWDAGGALVATVTLIRDSIA